MTRLKRGITITSTLMLVAALLSACNKPYSQTSAPTFTPAGQNNLFASAVPTTMGDVSAFATGSAIAQLTTTPSTPVTGATTAAGITPQVATATNTALVVVNPTLTATLALPSGPSATPVPSGSRPATYTLQPGEFPYCIARRFDVDPNEILQLSGLSEGVLYPAGTVLKIPQTGSFPGDRSWHDHPTTHTVGVTSSDETIYGVACYYGDIDPAAIAQANNLPVNTTLQVGQVLKIP